jgi:DNA-binding NtrC family response regulator
VRLQPLIIKASQSKSNVLIPGETGSGKDVIAKQIAEHAIITIMLYI